MLGKGIYSIRKEIHLRSTSAVGHGGGNDQLISVAGIKRVQLFQTAREDLSRRRRPLLVPCRQSAVLAETATGAASNRQ